MCGIAGILDREGTLTREPLVAMRDAMLHRGPDGHGIFLDPARVAGLAHARLAILDLVTGDQPMSTPDGRFTIVFNGEIYNYLELRDELRGAGETFRTASDTEVLLRGMIRHGKPFLERLNGIFAFALYDARERSLLAARDPFAVKPLYYSRRGERLLFASEVKSLLAAGIGARLDVRGLAEYLTLTYRLHGRTMFRDVHELPGGAWLEWRDGRIAFGRHHRLPAELGAERLPAEERAERLRGLLSDAVRLQMRADVPVGCHLSGGVDSSLVACLARRHNPGELHTFTGAFREGPFYDETPFARCAAAAVGSEHHETFPDGHAFFAEMEHLVRVMDEPSAGPSVHPQWHVSRLAASRLKVVLGGQGGDELFVGYPYALTAWLESLAFAKVPPAAAPFAALVRLNGVRGAAGAWLRRGLTAEERLFRVLSMWNPNGIRGVIHPDLYAALDGWSARESFRAAYRDGAAPGGDLDRISRYLVANYLRALLHVEDRVSMAVGLESRVPLLDRRVVDFILRLPAAERVPGCAPKSLLRRASAGILPAEILARRDKRGFPTPVGVWLSRGPARESFLDAVRSRDAFLADILHPAALERLRAGDLFFGPAGQINAWQFLCLELWGRAFRVAV